MRNPLTRGITSISLAVALCLGVQMPVYSAGQTFPIHQFNIKGNALISSAQLQEMVKPFTGEQRKYGDIQKALELIEATYRSLGYASVQVYVPEQDITQGEVIIDITETEIDQIITDDVEIFDRDNLLYSMPSLQVGYSPNNIAIARNVSLVNENPAKKVEAVMAMSEKEGKVDAKIKVKAEKPFSVTFTGDNTGNASTGDFRAGTTLAYANLFNRDQVMSFSYITSVTAKQEIPPSLETHTDKVGVYAFNYQIPLYDWSSSLGFSAVYSNTNAGTVIIPGGSLGFAGQGLMLGSRYVYQLPRKGTYSQKLTANLDYKHFDNTCSLVINGLALGCGSAGLDTEVLPLTLGYSGNMLDAGRMYDIGFSVSHNLAGSPQSRFDAVLPDRHAPRDFTIGRANAGVFSTFGKSDWQWRVGVQGQWTETALLAGEQIGLAGGSSLRGLSERQLSGDRGWASVVEVISPDASAWYGKEYGNLRFVLFWDHISGYNVNQVGDGVSAVSASSIGWGFRYNLEKNMTIKFDYGRVIELDVKTVSGAVSPLNAFLDTDRIHASFMYKF